MNFWGRTRRNHALEHASIGLMLNRPLANAIHAGYSIPMGFFVLGDVPTDTVRKASQQALERMQHGEGELAISPFCGTNMVVASGLSTLGVLLALRFSGGGPLGWMRSFSNVMWALMLSRPLGRMVQRRYTTSADVKGMSINTVSRHAMGKFVVHWVSTSFSL